MFHEAARRFPNEAFETFQRRGSKRIRSMPRKRRAFSWTNEAARRFERRARIEQKTATRKAGRVEQSNPLPSQNGQAS